MKKFVCTVCGYVYEGEAAPEKCPVCGVGADKFKEQTGEREWAAEHVVGVAKGVSEDILADLRANFEGECSEVGMYLAMARVAHREGYPEVGLYYEKAAWEEAEHAAKFAELLGEVVTDSTKKSFECSSVTCLISCHLMNCVMDCIQVSSFCTFCKVELTSCSAVLSVYTHLKVLLKRYFG